jgi:hypothetical protein
MQLTPYEHLINSINHIDTTYVFKGTLSKRELEHLTLLLIYPPRIAYDYRTDTSYITI